MKVFLTGASGFVGSHVLDSLLSGHHEVSILLRRTSNTRFISQHLPTVSVHFGSVGDVSALIKAMRGTEALIHCAGRTKAVHSSEFYQVNQAGTRNMVALQQRRPGAPQDRGRILGAIRIQDFDGNPNTLVRVYREWRMSTIDVQSLQLLADKNC